MEEDSRAMMPIRQHARTFDRLTVLEVSFLIFGKMLNAMSTIEPLDELAKRGHDVILVAPRVPNFREPNESYKLKLQLILIRRLTPVLSLIYFCARSYWQVLRLVSILDCLIADSNFFPLLLPIAILRHVTGHRPALFLRIQSTPIETGGKAESFLRLFFFGLAVRLAAIFADKILFISPAMAQVCGHEFSIPESKLAISSSPVGPQFFRDARPSETGGLRRELGLSSKRTVLHHGVLTAGRGIMELVNAFNILKTEMPSVILVLLGDGPLVEEIKRYIETNRLEDVVKLHGPVGYNQVPNYIAACDVEIIPLPDHPWWRYQCPTKLLECLAMNKPVIVSNIPASRWILGDVAGALFLRGTRPHQIADGVRLFFATRKNVNPKLGREIALRFSAQKIAESLEGDILSILQGQIT